MYSFFGMIAVFAFAIAFVDFIEAAVIKGGVVIRKYNFITNTYLIKVIS